MVGDSQPTDEPDGKQDVSREMPVDTGPDIQINYDSPLSGNTYRGLHSLELVENGDTVLDIHAAPEIVPDLENPAELGEFGEALQAVAEASEDLDL